MLFCTIQNIFYKMFHIELVISLLTNKVAISYDRFITVATFQDI